MMGTNYYWREEETTCPNCKRRDPDEIRLHIGKSSGGWCFSLHVDPEHGIETLGDWIERFQTGIIENEYLDPVSLEEMLAIITEREWSRSFDDRDWCGTRFTSGYSSEEDFHRKNHSERGPNNLLRHQIGRYCIGHGEGTYDLMVGEFS